MNIIQNLPHSLLELLCILQIFVIILELGYCFLWYLEYMEFHTNQNEIIFYQLISFLSNDFQHHLSDSN